MLRSQLPVDSSCKFVLRDVAGMSHLTILFGVVRDEIRWCLQCVIVSGLDCSVLLWIFDLVCSVWHGRGVTSQSVDPNFDRQWYMSEYVWIGNGGPNMTKLPIFQTRNPPKSSEATHVIWRVTSPSPAAPSGPRLKAAALCGWVRPPGGGRGAAGRGRFRRGEGYQRSRPSETGRMRQDGRCGKAVQQAKCGRDATRHWVCCQF